MPLGMEVHATAPLAQALPAHAALHAATHKWIADLNLRLEKDEAAESYVSRAERVMLDMRRLVTDQELETIFKDELKAKD